MNKFLTSILPGKGIYYIATPSENDKGFIHIPCTTIDEMVIEALRLDGLNQQVYFACASFRHKSYTDDNGKVRYRTAENAGWAKAFWLDIDCGSNKAAQETGYATPQDAINALLEFTKFVELPEPMVVSSGGGLHCYWLLVEKITKESWKPIADKLKALTRQPAIRLLADDSRTADIASVLRPVGTHNWKPERGGKEVKLKLDMLPLPFEQFANIINTAHEKYCSSPLERANCLVINRPKNNDPETPENIERVKSALNTISAGCEYDDWRNIVWAVASTGWSCAEEIAREWSASSLDKFSENAFDKVWRSFDATRGGSLGTLFNQAKQKGWVDIKQIASTNDEVPDWMQELNTKYAWIEADASIYRIEYCDYIEPSKFKQQYDNRKVPISSGNSTKSFGMGTAWVLHIARREHKSLVIRPAESIVTKDNCLNEWVGFQVKPIHGDIKPFLKLMIRLVPEREARRFIQSWLAHLVQHPEVKMHVSLAFWSHAQGVGKNLLFETLVAIIGKHHATVIGQNELTNDFNDWANRRVFVIGDEVSGSDKRQYTDKLKGLITGTTNRINEKYQPAREVPNLMNFVFLSNHHDALFVNDNDRRYFVWEILSDPLPPLIAGEFVRWRDNGGLSALLNFLLKFNISKFNPKASAPMTDAKQQMVDDNRSDLEAWVADLMASNVSQSLGRELATATELGRRYENETGHKAPSSKAIVGACKRLGAYARNNQVRIANGKKVRPLSLARTAYWKQQPEVDWAAEMAKPLN